MSCFTYTLSSKDLTAQNTGNYKVVLTNGKGSCEKLFKLAVKEPTPELLEQVTDLDFINALTDLSVVDGKISLNKCLKD